MVDPYRSYAMAEHHLDVDRPAEALRVLEDADEAALEDPYYWFLRCIARVGLEDFAEAARDAEQGLSIDPEHPSLLRAGSQAYMGDGRLADAERLLLTALHQFADDPDMLCAYSVLCSRAGQFEKAERLIAEAERLDPECSDLPRARFLLAELRGDDKASLVHAHEMVEANPDNAAAHALVGEKLFQQGAVDEADERTRVAANLDVRVVEGAEDSFRTIRTWSHWLMWPLRPIQRFGPGKIWAAAVVLIIGTGQIDLRLQAVVAVTWLIWVAYSWIIPPLVLRWERRRFRG